MSHRKNSLIGAPVLLGQSMTSSFTSPVTTVPYLDNIMLQIDYTGTPVGTFAVETSNNYDPNKPAATVNWIALTLSGTPTAAGAPDDILITLNQLPSPYIRVVYTAGSSTGSCNLYISGKEI